MSRVRVKLLRVDCGLLVELFRQKPGKLLYFEGMPDDAKIVGVFDEFVRNQIVLKVTSETFPEVPEGNYFSDIKVSVSDLSRRLLYELAKREPCE